MSNLTHVLTKVGEAYKGKVAPEGRFYHAVDLAACFDACERAMEGKYQGAKVLVPLNRDADKVKLRIAVGQEQEGSFFNYHQLDLGICIPEMIARESGLPSKPYQIRPHVIVLDRA